MNPIFNDDDTPTRELAVAVANMWRDMPHNSAGTPEIPGIHDIEAAIELRLDRIICTAKREMCLKYASHPCTAAAAVVEAFDLQKRLNEINWELSKRNHP